ncbi:hypothetical protein AVEN_42197-1 [Araneus ventricosus]|uniref:Uncharacterized protein n=1 Tax=Araneus ventricosus TaxID=182803 RepID=A0A4Y2B0F9_ARAVE|nr:hypothetical protein AVEN_42197-1 [Araneus ventricosus]
MFRTTHEVTPSPPNFHITPAGGESQREKSLLSSSLASALEKKDGSRPKEHHPALPKHPGKQQKDRPPQQIVRHCGSCIIAPITSGSCCNPPFYRGTTRRRKWAQRATPPPLLCHRVDESLLTYTAASPPRTLPDGVGWK